MRQSKQTRGERIVPQGQLLKDIKRKTREQYSSEEKIRIVLEACAARKVLRSYAE